MNYALFFCLIISSYLAHAQENIFFKDMQPSELEKLEAKFSQTELDAAESRLEMIDVILNEDKTNQTLTQSLRADLKLEKDVLAKKQKDLNQQRTEIERIKYKTVKCGEGDLVRLDQEKISTNGDYKTTQGPLRNIGVVSQHKAGICYAAAGSLLLSAFENKGRQFSFLDLALRGQAKGSYFGPDINGGYICEVINRVIEQDEGLCLEDKSLSEISHPMAEAADQISSYIDFSTQQQEIGKFREWLEPEQFEILQRRAPEVLSCVYQRRTNLKTIEIFSHLGILSNFQEYEIDFRSEKLESFLRKSYIPAMGKANPKKMKQLTLELMRLYRTLGGKNSNEYKWEEDVRKDLSKKPIEGEISKQSMRECLESKGIHSKECDSIAIPSVIDMLESMPGTSSAIGSYLLSGQKDSAKEIEMIELKFLPHCASKNRPRAKLDRKPTCEDLAPPPVINSDDFFRYQMLSNLYGKNPKPVGISYCAGVLTNENEGNTSFEKCSTERHASTVIGARFNKSTNRCDFLIQNSWGETCTPYSKSHECEKGKVWLDEKILLPSMNKVHMLR